MQPHQRVIAAMNREPLDRVPLRLNARAEVIEALLAHLGFGSQEQLLERLGVDFRYVRPRYCGPYPRPGGYVPPDAPPRPERSSAVAARNIRNNFRVYHPFANMRSADELEPYEEHLARTLAYDDPTSILQDVRRINARRRYFIGFKGGARLLQGAMDLRGQEQLLLDLALNPEFVHRLMEIQTDHALRKLESILSVAGHLIDIVHLGDDWGTQSSLMISPEMIREFLLPRYRRVIETIRRYGPRIFFHCCGAIRPIIPDMIEIGVDILNPVQISARGMEPEELKRDFGDRLTFCGGMDVQSVLPFGSVQDVRREVARLVDVLGRGGGFILDSTNLIQPDTPVENILAMFDAARECPVGRSPAAAACVGS